jgi:hypothetical protein
MSTEQALTQGTRVRDAIGARVYGTDERGTVDRMSGDTHAWVKWDGYDIADDLCHTDDLEVI